MPTDMTNAETRLIEGLEQAIDILGKTTGLAIKGRVAARKPRPRTGYRPDAFIDIRIDGEKYRHAVEVKANIDRLAPIGHLKTQLAQFGERGLLYAPYITTAVAKKCRELDIAFLDAVGNAYLQLPGLYIFITGGKPHEQVEMVRDRNFELPTATRIRAGTPAALRVIFTLLCQPRLLNAPYREIKQAAGVALGAVGPVFDELATRGHLVGGTAKHDRRLIDAPRLFEEWVTNYPIKLRPKLNTKFFRAEDPEWWQRANLNALGAYWGGEVAAARLTQYLKPANVTVYINADKNPRALAQLAVDHRLRADPRGNIEVVDAFWDLPDNQEYPEVVPPILAYADLVATHNPRNLDAAKLIRERYIDRALRKP
jgi:hypothetical protein